MSLREVLMKAVRTEVEVYCCNQRAAKTKHPCQGPFRRTVSRRKSSCSQVSQATRDSEATGKVEYS